ncbi:MAG: tetratricopeptide repeat protein [Chloroflexi bacterium]|nr:MAG: tetratricopeptide repeat protein [Chloroflexota bacterium]
MHDPDQFTNVLQTFVNRSAYTPGQLASLSSVPKTTIVNWLNGRVQRPRHYDGILAIAVALRLTSAELNQLLTAAQHPTLQELRSLSIRAAEREKLAYWTPSVSSPHGPFQAIALPTYFVGRAAEQTAIKDALLESGQTAVTCIHGMAGVGKTSLAAQIAYQLRPHFADGVLWARLDSSDTMSILATFAAAYQHDVSAYHDIASRSRLVRDLLMAKQVLIVLDNAQTSDQIEPLLPPTGRCAVLVTTRRQDLSILAGVKRFEIRPFSPNAATSLALFEKILGPERVQAESHRLTQIANALGHLPLALVIAASRLAYEPGWHISQFEARVNSVQQRLGTLQFGAQNVRHLFQLSYELLDGQAQQLFAAVGRLGRQSFSIAAAAAVVGLDEGQAADGLRRLHSLSLVQSEVGNGRFHLHPLLHDFAHSLPLPDAATERLVSYWTSFLADHVYDHATIANEMGHVEAAWQLVIARGEKRPLHAMLANLMPFFIVRGAYLQAEQFLIQAESTLKAAGDVDDFVWIQLWMGQIERHRHALDRAETILQAGLAQAKQNPGLTAQFMVELGIVCNCREQYAQSKMYLAKALPLARQENVGDSLLNLLEELGIIALMEGEYATAESYYQEGLDLATAQNHEAQVVVFYKSLGALRHLANDKATARHLFVQGQALAQKIGFRKGTMFLENNLGVVNYYEGNRTAAQKHLNLAEETAIQLNDTQALSLIQHNLTCWTKQANQNLLAANPSERLKVFI